MSKYGYTEFDHPLIGHVKMENLPPDSAFYKKTKPDTMSAEVITIDMAGRPDNGFANERQFQAAAFQWTWNTFPELRRLFFHPKNEGVKNIQTAMQDRAEGVVPGVADIVCLMPLFVAELKQPGKKQSEDQLKFETQCKKAGIKYFLFEYLEDYQRVVTAEIEKIKWW